MCLTEDAILWFAFLVVVLVVAIWASRVRQRLILLVSLAITIGGTVQAWSALAGVEWVAFGLVTLISILTIRGLID